MKKILGLTVAAVLVMALVGGGTWAYFSDVETATDILTAGTIDLEGDGSWTSGVTLANMKPGATITTVTFKNVGTLPGDLTFTGTAPSESDAAQDTQATFEFAASVSGFEDAENEMTAEQYQRLIYVTIADDGGAVNPITTEAGLTTTNGDGKISLYELVNNSDTIAELVTWATNESVTLTFYLGFGFDGANTNGAGAPPSVWSTYLGASPDYDICASDSAWNVPQADGMTMDITATLTQQ